MSPSFMGIWVRGLHSTVKNLYNGGIYCRIPASLDSIYDQKKEKGFLFSLFPVQHLIPDTHDLSISKILATALRPLRGGKCLNV